MIVLNPRSITFGTQRWEGVSAVFIERTAATLIEEWSDLGPHAVLIDVAQARVSIRIEQAIAAGGTLESPTPGQSAEIVIEVGPSSADLRRQRLRATAVITAVSLTSSDKGASRIITLRAVSPTGAADPITIEPV